MYIWGNGRAVGRSFCRQARVRLGQRFAGSGPKKVTRGQLLAPPEQHTNESFSQKIALNNHCTDVGKR